MPFQLLRRFTQLESASSILLLLSTLLALFLANSPLQRLYQDCVHYSAFFVNEGLMTLFFLLVGLELKREFYEGDLAANALLSGAAALGGMLVPAIIYILFNYQHPDTIIGWAIPVATDIAFALGVLSIFGRRVPIGLKLFLMALAIFDDVGAIIIIALFYVEHFFFSFLLLALGITLVLYLLNKFKIKNLSLYILGGVGIWFCLCYSGVHPTLAGVLLALVIPLRDNENKKSTFNQLESYLHGWVSLVIMPLFALMNAGLSFADFEMAAFYQPLVLGITLGLFMGKQMGVLFFSWLVIKLRWAKLPPETNWLSFYGVALLCGIGFTMSLFIGTLSFENAPSMYLNNVRFGVMVGSLLSGVLGGLILCLAFINKPRQEFP